MPENDTNDSAASPYYPGAPAWYLRAARQALPDEDFPDWKNMASDGVGISLLHAEQDGRVTVWIAVNAPRRSHMERPPRNSEAEERWCSARDAIAHTLKEAGFTDIVLTQAGLLATAPAPEEKVRIHLRRENALEGGRRGQYDIWCPEHPHLRGRLASSFGHGPGVTVDVYGAADDKEPVWHSFHDLYEAAGAWAAHCGLPTPAEITEL